MTILSFTEHLIYVSHINKYFSCTLYTNPKGILEGKLTDETNILQVSATYQNKCYFLLTSHGVAKEWQQALFQASSVFKFLFLFGL